MMMTKSYFLFSRLRYRDTAKSNPIDTIEKIESCLGARFTEINGSRGLAEKRYISEIFGMEIRLEYWQYQDGIYYTLAGQTEIYDDWESVDIIKLNDYVISVLEFNGMPDWYIPSLEEMQKDSDLSGGEHTS